MALDDGIRQKLELEMQAAAQDAETLFHQAEAGRVLVTLAVAAELRAARARAKFEWYERNR